MSAFSICVDMFLFYIVFPTSFAPISCLSCFGGSLYAQVK
jgi:hypothetical protein